MRDPGPEVVDDEPSDDAFVRSYLSALWAQDWDCDEDKVYDTW